MAEIEFHTRKDGSQVVGVHIGGQVIVMSPAEWEDIAIGILALVSPHLTPVAVDLSPALYSTEATKSIEKFAVERAERKSPSR